MHDCLMKNTATIKQLSESKDPGIITCEESTEKKSKEKGVQNGKIRKGGGVLLLIHLKAVGHCNWLGVV